MSYLTGLHSVVDKGSLLIFSINKGDKQHQEPKGLLIKFEDGSCVAHWFCGPCYPGSLNTDYNVMYDSVEDFEEVMSKQNYLYYRWNNPSSY